MENRKELITHILLHLNAEDSGEEDPSQTPGVAKRAAYLRTYMESFLSDTTETTKDGFLALLSSGVAVDVDKTSFQTMIQNIRDEGNSSPQLAIQEWVGKKEEFNRGD